MNGFLDTNGQLHECNAWEHLDEAAELVENMGITVANRLEAEERLQQLGWIVIRDRDVYGLIGYHLDGKDECLHLTPEQKTFLNDLYSKVNKSCQESIDELFSWDS